MHVLNPAGADAIAEPLLSMLKMSTVDALVPWRAAPSADDCARLQSGRGTQVRLAMGESEWTAEDPERWDGLS